MHTHTGILFSKKKKILPFATMWMDSEGIMPSEINQKDKYHMISYGELKKKRAKLTEIENRMVVARCWEVGEWKDISLRV